MSRIIIPQSITYICDSCGAEYRTTTSDRVPQGWSLLFCGPSRMSMVQDSHITTNPEPPDTATLHLCAGCSQHVRETIVDIATAKKGKTP